VKRGSSVLMVALVLAVVMLAMAIPSSMPIVRLGKRAATRALKEEVQKCPAQER
jgi:predicted metal-binding membrane protein